MAVQDRRKSIGVIEVEVSHQRESIIGGRKDREGSLTGQDVCKTRRLYRRDQGVEIASPGSRLNDVQKNGLFRYLGLGYVDLRNLLQLGYVDLRNLLRLGYVDLRNLLRLGYVDLRNLLRTLTSGTSSGSVTLTSGTSSGSALTAGATTGQDPVLAAGVPMPME